MSKTLKMITVNKIHALHLAEDSPCQHPTSLYLLKLSGALLCLGQLKIHLKKVISK